MKEHFPEYLHFVSSRRERESEEVEFMSEALVYLGEFFKKKLPGNMSVLHTMLTTANDTSSMRVALKQVNTIMKQHSMSRGVLSSDIVPRLKTMLGFNKLSNLS